MTTPETTPEAEHRSEADWAAAAAWAEQQDTDPATATRVLRGAEAAADGRAVLEAALGGPQAVEQAIEGRPKLNPGTPRGQYARQRKVRLPADLDAALDTLAAAQDRRASDVLRDALTDYVHTHPAAS